MNSSDGILKKIFVDVPDSMDTDRNIFINKTWNSNMVKKYLKYTDSECVTKEVAQKFIDTLAEQYSTKTVRGLYDVVNAAFRLAYSDGLIKENPFED